MKSCDEELLEEHALGRAGARAAAIEAHVADCAGCARELAALRRDRASLSAALASRGSGDVRETAPDFAAVMARVARAPVRRTGRAYARTGAVAAGALAAAAALTLAVRARVPSAPSAPEIAPLAPAELVAPQVGLPGSAEDDVRASACSDERGGPPALVCAEPVEREPARVTGVSLRSRHGDVCE